jgi:rubrerythrin
MTGNSIRLLVGTILLLIMAAVTVSFSGERTEYPATIAALKTAYQSEILAHDRCMAFAQKANAEQYPEIANLFTAIAVSEGIHARNYKSLLIQLGSEPDKTPGGPIKVAPTNVNLKVALDAEIEQIEQAYPGYLEKIRSENHAAATKIVLQELESEKQHLDMLKQIRSGTGIFFGMLTKKMAEQPVQFDVCQVCGSTVTERPKEVCPICKGSVANYKVIERGTSGKKG